MRASIFDINPRSTPLPMVTNAPNTPSSLSTTLLRHVSVGPHAERMEIKAPFTGEPTVSLPLCSADDMRDAVGRARQAQASWAVTPHRLRRAILLRYHDLVLDHQDELMDLMQLEAGKARRHALEEVVDVANVARYYAIRAERMLRARRRRGALPWLTHTVEYHHPVGVVGLIAPWNYPLSMAITDAIPALLAGNAVVLKPAEQTSLTALRAVELLVEAGLPNALFQVVTGEGPTLGPALIDTVDFVGFTGSTNSGRIVARAAADRLIPCSLELGGKNPAIVFNDANLDKAVEGLVRGCFTSAGQLCISIERVYVQSGVYDEFVSRFAARVERMRLGASSDYDIEMGSLVSPAQYEKTVAHVEDALAKGADARAGGRARPDVGPYFYAPTVLEGVTPDMTVAAEETFGPVVSVYRVEDEADAVRQSNASAYGLNASVWTRDTTRGRRIAQQLTCGTVNVNESYAATWGSVDAPMGGMKASGLGRRHGREGLLKYTESQTVSVQRGLALGPEAGQNAAKFAGLMTTALRILRHIPFLR